MGTELIGPMNRNGTGDGFGRQPDHVTGGNGG